MSLDAATLALVAGELKNTLLDAKIDKIFEPTRDEVLMTLRTRTETHRLLLSARSGSARVCLTKESFENPETPPSFCMLMRKHLTGGRLLDVHMEPGDRIVYFDFQCTNEMGDLVRNTLCAELMGRYSNLVLVQNGKIIDALKRVDFEDSDVRQLLPGLPYTTPPKPARPDFLLVSSASIVAAACQRDLPVADALSKTVAGVGPVVCREAAWRAFDGEHLPANELTEEQKRKLMAAIDELKEEHATGGTPCSVTDPSGKPIEYTFFRPQQYGERSGPPSTPCWRATTLRRTARNACAPKARSCTRRCTICTSAPCASRPPVRKSLLPAARAKSCVCTVSCSRQTSIWPRRA
jgi:predicted ribosome quality control (RQC) complex YloA/Tae2 family protein